MYYFNINTYSYQNQQQRLQTASSRGELTKKKIANADIDNDKSYLVYCVIEPFKARPKLSLNVLTINVMFPREMFRCTSDIY